MGDNALQMAGVEALGLLGGLLGKEQHRELLGSILPLEPPSSLLPPVPIASLAPPVIESCMNSHASFHACMGVWTCMCVCA